MIVQTYKSKRPDRGMLHSILPHPAQPKQSQMNYPHQGMTEDRPDARDISRSRQFNITPEEFVRRDKIVRQLYIDSAFRPGEVLRPKGDQGFMKYGRCTVKGIYKSYHDFSTAEAKDWPDDDKPFIMTVEPERCEPDYKLLLVVPAWLTRFGKQA